MKTIRPIPFALPCVLLLALAACGGCMRAISEGVGLATGPKAVTSAVSPISPIPRDVSLMRYANFELQFTDNFGGRTPPEVFWRLGPEFERAMAKKNIRINRNGRTLLVRGEILHYETASHLDHVFGPLEELIARVTFIDKPTGKTLGVYNCIGRSTHSVNIGLDKKIEGLAKAVATVIANHYPGAK